MKKRTSFKWIITFLVITIAAVSGNSFAQTRLPDGTVVYSDGTVRLPNGQVRYPNKTNGTTYPADYPDYSTGRYPSTATRQSDGSIIYPDGRIVYPDGTIRYPDGRVYSRTNNSRWMPPGQAKKMYGSKSATTYAPGYNKHRQKEYEHEEKEQWKQEDKDANEQHKQQEKNWKNQQKERKEEHKHH